MNNPLVSICILSHNQREYVERTLEGAFSQTYSPLEIVISDDGSTDGTSELVTQLLQYYSKINKTIKITFNRNEKALGMLGNREKVYALANGELLVNADGDDISFPKRVESLVEAWLSKEKKPSMLTSEAIIIDENDRPLGQTHLHGKPIGATLALAASVRDLIPSVCHDAAYHAHDDLVYHIRASLLGETLSVNQPLIFYRYGSGESSGGKYRKKMIRGFTGIISGMKQILLDIKTCQGKIPPEKLIAIQKRAEKEIAFSEAILPLWQSSSFLTRVKTCLQTKYYVHGITLFLVCWILILPLPLGDLLFFCGERIKRYFSLKRARNLPQVNSILHKKN